MRRTKAGSGDVLPLADDSSENKKNDYSSTFNWRSLFTVSAVLIVLVFLYHQSKYSKNVAESLEDCMLDVEGYHKDLHDNEEIIDALEKVIIRWEDKKQEASLSTDHTRGYNAQSSRHPYRLVDVLQLPESLSDAQVMTAFQDKWGLRGNSLYPLCGLVTSRKWPAAQPRQQHSSCRIAVLTSWSPRSCGIATYSSKLVQGMEGRCPAGSVIDVVAVRNPQEPSDFYDKEPKVKHSFQRDVQQDYDQAADFINSEKYDIVILSYEFGIFGDELVMCMLKQIHNARVITVLHTVAENLPWQKQALTQQVMMLSHSVVVMTDTMRREVSWLHAAPRGLVTVVPHGVPAAARLSAHSPPSSSGSDSDRAARAEEISRFWGINSDKILLSNGLLHQGKGIEHVLAAMPAVLQVHPDAKYVIQGAPHPTGEGTSEYLHMLRSTARALNLEDSVVFFPEFLSEPLLLERLRHSRVFINAYVDRMASVSGTLIMAMGVGLPCISTPYPFAREVLADQGGMLVPFADPGSIAKAVVYLLSNPAQAAAIGQRAQENTHTWEEVASTFLDIGYNF